MITTIPGSTSAVLVATVTPTVKVQLHRFIHNNVFQLGKCTPAWFMGSGKWKQISSYNVRTMIVRTMVGSYNVVWTLPLYCTNIIRTDFPHYTNIVRTLYEHCTNIGWHCTTLVDKMKNQYLNQIKRFWTNSCISLRENTKGNSALSISPFRNASRCSTASLNSSSTDRPSNPELARFTNTHPLWASPSAYFNTCFLVKRTEQPRWTLELSDESEDDEMLRNVLSISHSWEIIT